MGLRRDAIALLLCGFLPGAIALGCGSSHSNSSSGTTGPANNHLIIDPPDGTLLTPGTVGTVYTQTFVVTGGGTPPFTFTAVTVLPPGFALLAQPPAAAAIHGSPTVAGTTTFTLQVIDATNANITNASYKLTVN
jgi:hypothetical protein